VELATTGHRTQEPGGVPVLIGDPGFDLGVVVGFQPLIGVANGDAVAIVDGVVAPRGRRGRGGGAQPRPALGLVP